MHLQTASHSDWIVWSLWLRQNIVESANRPTTWWFLCTNFHGFVPQARWSASCLPTLSLVTDLMAMKVVELKEELEAREEGKTGNKAWLRRRLHTAIVREHLEASRATTRRDTFTEHPAHNWKSPTFTILN